MGNRTLKNGETFLFADERGDLSPETSYGLYRSDTRFLSRWQLKIEGMEPVFLLSEMKDDHDLVLLTNPHIEKEGKVVLWRESLQLKRKRFIYQNHLYETIAVKSYHPQPIAFQLSLEFDADFKDMFMIRGFQNGKTGAVYERLNEKNCCRIKYCGKDGIQRQTSIYWNDVFPAYTEKQNVHFPITLEHLDEKIIELTVVTRIGDELHGVLSATEAYDFLQQQKICSRSHEPVLKTNSQTLNHLLNRGMRDLQMLATDIGEGLFPVAGLPWFAVPFGRDSLIAALQLLPFQPKVAQGTLRTMAKFQGKTYNAWRDEQPGKIMHEIRFGELANTNQVPFTPYYGSIDATPLFLILLGEYVLWTGDINLFLSLEENVQRALEWIDVDGDLDGDGFIEYERKSEKGIANQGWKDSEDAIVHESGEYAHAPIALCEVQGYVYRAKVLIARIYHHIGKKKISDVLQKQAEQLKVRFHKKFWMKDRRYYAIALDANKKPVGTITSNPGHLLYCGILDFARAKDVARMLVSEKMFSGYGIRTMGAGEAGYNPLSYHNGSIWPHDNSLIIAGLVQYGFTKEASRVAEGLIQAGTFFENFRLPELFCGFSQDAGRPVPYPVACSPQAWAAGTPLLLLQSLLGLKVNSLEGFIQISPYLEGPFQSAECKNLKIGSGVLSFSVKQNRNHSDIQVKINTTGLAVKAEQPIKIC